MSCSSRAVTEGKIGIHTCSRKKLHAHKAMHKMQHNARWLAADACAQSRTLILHVTHLYSQLSQYQPLQVPIGGGGGAGMAGHNLAIGPEGKMQGALLFAMWSHGKRFQHVNTTIPRLLDGLNMCEKAAFQPLKTGNMFQPRSRVYRMLSQSVTNGRSANCSVTRRAFVPPVLPVPPVLTVLPVPLASQKSASSVVEAPCLGQQLG